MKEFKDGGEGRDECSLCELRNGDWNGKRRDVKDYSLGETRKFGERKVEFGTGKGRM